MADGEEMRTGLGFFKMTTRSELNMAADGFAWEERKNGEIVIRHHGQTAATLRGVRAKEFRAEVETADDQELMARLTGNYKRGNERWARKHPRNKDN